MTKFKFMNWYDNLLLSYCCFMYMTAPYLGGLMISEVSALSPRIGPCW